MIALFLLAYTLLAFFAIIAVFQKNLILHIIINAIMYLYYGYLWYDRLFLSFDTKPAFVGFSLVLNTIFTAPFYIIFHLIVIYQSRALENRAIVYVNIAGLLLCMAHLIYLFY